jgi:hypothetical protein
MDPETIAAAIGAALSYLESAQQADWEGSVSLQLKAIADALDQIYAYLQQIPQIISAALDDAQRKQWQATMQAYVKNVNDFIHDSPNGPADDAATARWTAQFDELKTLIEEVDNFQLYGFGQFAVVALGVSSAAGLVAFLGDDKGLFRLLVKSVLTYYQSAVDPTVPNSLSSALAAQSSAQSQVIAQYNPWFNSVWCTGRSGQPVPGHGSAGGGGIPGQTFAYSIPGSVQTGLGATTISRVPAAVSVPFMPGTSGPNSDDQGRAILNGAVAQYNAVTHSIADIQKWIASCQKIAQEFRGATN